MLIVDCLVCCRDCVSYSVNVRALDNYKNIISKFKITPFNGDEWEQSIDTLEGQTYTQKQPVETVAEESTIEESVAEESATQE